MKFRVFTAFKDPVRRPRAVIWTGVVVLCLAVVVILALGVTSTRWFCSESCHKVQDDTIIAYESSSHAEISCMACHGPADGNIVGFVLHKAKSLGEVYLTLTKTYELPLNGESHLAVAGKEMGSEQCTQCHGPNRVATPADGILIDHKVHADNDIRCTICHNRVAHPEDFELTLTDPGSNKPNRKHEDFMRMEACFRCHTQTPGAAPAAEPAKSEAEGEGDAESDGEGAHETAALPVKYEAPGACDACHPADFELKPANHMEKGFYKRFGDSKGHAEMAREDPGYCAICHNPDRFCAGCHGIAMPHPADFEKSHGKVGREKPKVCSSCHAKTGAQSSATEFCNGCHHKQAKPGTSWLKQHFVVVRSQGAGACFDCHKPTYCATCHVRGISQ